MKDPPHISCHGIEHIYYSGVTHCQHFGGYFPVKDGNGKEQHQVKDPNTHCAGRKKKTKKGNTHEQTQTHSQRHTHSHVHTCTPRKMAKKQHQRKKHKKHSQTHTESYQLCYHLGGRTTTHIEPRYRTHLVFTRNQLPAYWYYFPVIHGERQGTTLS